MQKLKTDQIR